MNLVLEKWVRPTGAEENEPIKVRLEKEYHERDRSKTPNQNLRAEGYRG